MVDSSPFERTDALLLAVLRHSPRGLAQSARLGHIGAEKPPGLNVGKALRYGNVCNYSL